MGGSWKFGAVTLIGVAGLALAGCTLTPKTKVATPNPCEDLKVSIYFDQHSAKLTEDAKGVLREAAQIRRSCAVGVVDVTGLASAAGSSRENQQLSENRAKAVTAALGGLGFGNVRFDAAGAAGAVTATGQQEPLRRQAEVIFRDKP
ncbi:OmpA family protein [Caulobacter mirabilis]|uniref:Flagellar motor protein MotB n=1 Tax=Caulobacter mirabilis TaxID=69666 RepID=A0A2D2ASJ0_9CAUL|nr:OmpA family protein [Caulobacter mirabilis]ATQ40956.1 flagellar motor protein MotB [Caulobacter mirabilis]